MADIKEISSNEELLTKMKNFIDSPKFNPKNQDKYFFSDGLSYYQQLSMVLKVLDNYAEAFQYVYDNESTLAENSLTSDKLASAISDLKTEIESEIEALDTKNQTKFNDIDTLLTSHTSALATLNTSLQSKLNKVEFSAYGLTITDNGVTDGVQKFTVINEGGSSEGGATFTENLSYANTNQTEIVTGIAKGNNVDNTNTISNYATVSKISEGAIVEENINVVSFSASDFKRDGNGNILSNLDTSMFATTSELDNLSQSVSLNTLDITTNENDIATLKTKTSALETKANSNASNIESLVTRTDSLESASAAASTNITNLATRMSNVESKASTNESSIATLQTKDSELESSISGKQDTLVSGTNIKTINSESLLGSGDVVLSSFISIDTTNCLSANKTSLPYTATENCYFVIGLGYSGTGLGYLKINDTTYAIVENAKIYEYSGIIPLKAGDILSVTGSYSYRYGIVWGVK